MACQRYSEDHGTCIQRGVTFQCAACTEEIATRPRPPRSFEAQGTALGRLVEEKQVAYGDSAGKAGRIMAVLYPDGIPAHAYDDALLMVRVIDKLSRIAQRGVDGKDLGGESPWRDIASYGLLGTAKDGAK